MLQQTVRNALGPTGDVYEERAWRAMDRELRALLRVAREAREWSNTADGEFWANGGATRLMRSIDALDRVSGRQRKGGR